MNEVDQIRQQMAHIRHDLHQDVSGVVSGVVEVMDWRSLPHRYPWTTVCAALAAGYFIVPRPTGQTIQPAPALAEAAQPEPEKPTSAWGRIVGRTIRLLWPIAEHAIQTYALIWVEGQLKQYLLPGHAGPPSSEPEKWQTGTQRDVSMFSVGDNDR